MASPNDNKVNVLIVTIIILTTLSTSSFIGRIWGRILSAVRLGWEDAMMFAALVGCWAITADNAIAIHFGAGKHATTLQPSDIRKYLMTFWAFFFLQTVTTTLIKVTILALYHRIFTTRSFQRAVYIVGAIILVDALAIFFVVCFLCVPIKYLWAPSTPGKCLDTALFTTLASSTLLVTDLILYIMPVPVIWKLQTTTKQKVQITAIFLLGGLVCLSRTVQIIDSSRLDFSDMTYSNTDVAIWNMVEAHIGAFTANISLMGPLFSRIGKSLKIASDPVKTWYGQKRRMSGVFNTADNRTSLQRKVARAEDGFQRINNGFELLGVDNDSMKTDTSSRLAEPKLFDCRHGLA